MTEELKPTVEETITERLQRIEEKLEEQTILLDDLLIFVKRISIPQGSVSK